MTLALQAEPIHQIGNLLMVAHTRVTVDTVLECFLDGATPEEIVLRYPALELPVVYEVIAYYLRHQTELNAYLEESSKQRAALQLITETRFDPIGIRARLLERKQ
jgi:uncharacterized protein (DUF433 family)